jgi:hypothetical protein
LFPTADFDAAGAAGTGFFPATAGDPVVFFFGVAAPGAKPAIEQQVKAISSARFIGN